MRNTTPFCNGFRAHYRGTLQSLEYMKRGRSCFTRCLDGFLVMIK